MNTYTKEQLITILKRFYKDNGQGPKMDDLKGDKNLPCHMTYFKRFGSWNQALEEAGLEINVKKNYGKGELLNLLINLYKKLDRNPTSKDLGKKNNMPDRSVFEDKFGSWNNALEEAGLKVNCYYRKWTKEEIIQ